MTFRCNICSAPGEAPENGFPRDAPSCAGCGSTVRLRALMRALSLELFGVALPLPDFPVVKSIRGLGLSDDLSCAGLLASKLDYRNTFFHQPPRFDIVQGAETESGTYDFILSGDVFEHVASPQTAFRNAFAMLKPHGFLAMTVPYLPDGATEEHFPCLHEYGLVKAGSRMALVNRTRAGEWQVFDRLVFHGGGGSTLEMRVFAEADLRRELAEAGFTSVDFAIDDDAPLGIVHRESWSLPLIARKGEGPLRREMVAEIVSQYAKQLERLRWTDAEKVRLEDLCQELNTHLESANGDLQAKTRWALSVQEEIEKSAKEIARLQAEEAQLRAELESRTAASRASESELRSWALERDSHAQNSDAEVKRLQSEFEERTGWALKLQSELEERTREIARLSTECETLKRQLGAWEASRWSHFGKALGWGPKL